jgi:hypothetical protein
LRELERMYEDILMSLFFPDKDRSGRFSVFHPRGPKAGVPFEAPLESSSEDSSDSSSSDTEPDDVRVLMSLESCCRRRENNLDGLDLGELFQHCERFTFHVKPDPEVLKFKCGRAVTHKFEVVCQPPKVLLPRCSDCFRGIVFDDKELSSESEDQM